MVFLGTIVEAIGTPANSQTTRARMRVDHAYKGVTEPLLIMVDDGMCDGPELRVGEQYLMYTRRNPDGTVQWRGCTRSRHVDDAEEDLRYLKDVGQARPTGRIYGRVFGDSDANDSAPVEGAAVAIRGDGKSFDAVTDSDGQYSLMALPPARYTVEVTHPRFLMRPSSGPLETTAVAGGGCAVVDVAMRKRWPATIAGRLIRADGEPAGAGIDLHLLRVIGQGDEIEYEMAFYDPEMTNAQGEYAFRGIRPGRYKVVVHDCCFATPVAPYPPIYWPAARNQRARRRDPGVGCRDLTALRLPAAGRDANRTGEWCRPIRGWTSCRGRAG